MRSLCHDVKMKWKAFALQHRTKNKVLVVLILLFRPNGMIPSRFLGLIKV